MAQICYEDMVTGMNGDIDDMDMAMSQIVTDCDEMDQIISQIDTDAIQHTMELKVEVSANVEALDEMDEANDEALDEMDEANVEELDEMDEANVEALDDMDELEVGTEILQKMQQEVNNDLVRDIPVAVLEQYQKAMDGILPNKSGNRYLQAYDVFTKWQSSNGTHSFDEKVIMAYFFEASTKYKPSTLWSMFSMLKKTIICKHNINIAKYCQLYAWLKKTSDGFESKKSNVFTPEEINRFVVEAPNVRYLAMKAVLGFGITITGVCRGDELVKLTTNNVKDNADEIIVKIPVTKTKEPKTFIIDGEFANIIRQYIKLRPAGATTNRFFLRYSNGKCVNQVIGKHTLANIPKEIAKFLQLPDPLTYTGHSYRRSGTTIAADAGASIEDLKRLGSWKSTSVCERYIQDSLGNKRKLAKFISGAIDLPLTSSTDITNESGSTSEIGSERATSSVPPTTISGTSMQLTTSAGHSLTFPTNAVPSMPFPMNVAPSMPLTLRAGPSTKFTVPEPASAMSTTKKLESTGISIPDNNENIVFHFGGNCSNVTIINFTCVGAKIEVKFGNFLSISTLCM